MLPFLKVMFRNLLLGPSTDAFPFAPAKIHPNFRGRVVFDPDKCILCGICRHVCAPGAIQLRAAEDGSGMQYMLWHNSCVVCGLCAHYCPTGAVSMSPDWSQAHRGEDMFAHTSTAFIGFGACEQCGAKIQPRPKAIVDKLGGRNPDRFLLCPQCKRQSVAKDVSNVRPISRRDRP